jgi:hypothetical protein
MRTTAVSLTALTVPQRAGADAWRGQTRSARLDGELVEQLEHAAALLEPLRRAPPTGQESRRRPGVLTTALGAMPSRTTAWSPLRPHVTQAAEVLARATSSYSSRA